jgi:cellulose synthase/poly-beta-1,6-N-acetylglucosamine synthase-like glycosyltransferase
MDRILKKEIHPIKLDLVYPSLFKTYVVGNSEVEVASLMHTHPSPYTPLSKRKINAHKISKFPPEQLKLSFLTLKYSNFKESFDTSLVDKLTLEEVIQLQVVPAKLENGILTILTSQPNNPEMLKLIEEKFQPEKIQEFIVDSVEIFEIASEHFKQKALHNAVYGLYEKFPEKSARYVFSNRQVNVLALISLISIFWLYFAPFSLLLTIFFTIQIIFFIVVVYRFILTLGGVMTEMTKEIPDSEVKELNESELPIYSILVPVYKEPQTIPLLMRSLRNLDYPQSKIEVLLLFEENDIETIDAAKRAHPPKNWLFVYVPDCQPKTKPKACSYGLQFTRGKYVTIYDAEDLPDRDQLKKACIGHRRQGKDGLCVQAALNYFNAYENFITAMFTLEYSYWFDYLLPGLDHFKLPIPLGGTSNHFQTENLRKVGAWDAFNTTEDADLGMRAFAQHMKVGVINSTTFEEANNKYGNWIRQRSRWIKGYMQTALVYNRHPIKLIKQTGFVNWLSFQLIITGTPLVFLFTPIIWLCFFVGLLNTYFPYMPNFPFYFTYLSVFNLVVGNFIAIYFNMLGVFKRRLFIFIPLALLNPLYWLFFHSIAAYKALFQLFYKPFYWEKTTHGLTQFKVPEN